MSVSYHLVINPGSRLLKTVKTEVTYIKSPQEHKHVVLSVIKDFIVQKELNPELVLYKWSTHGFDLRPHITEFTTYEEVKIIERMFPTNLVVEVFIFTESYLKEKKISKQELIIHYDDCYFKELPGINCKGGSII